MSNPLMSVVPDDTFEELYKHLNQLQGLAGGFTVIDLEIMTPKEHAGAA
jgi:hypothetical protein